MIRNPLYTYCAHCGRVLNWTSGSRPRRVKCLNQRCRKMLCGPSSGACYQEHVPVCSGWKPDHAARVRAATGDFLERKRK